MIMIRLKGFEFGGSSQVKENREKFVSDLINYNNGTATFDKDYIKQDLVNGVTDKEKLEFLNKDKEFTQTNFMRNEQNEKVIERYKVPNQKKELIREDFSKSDEYLPHKQPSKAYMLGIQALKLRILTIYYICEIFPKNSEIDKKFFSGSELNYILDKHSHFFYTINESLKDKNLIRYYGTVKRKKKSNEKIYIITEYGIKFTEEIIDIKRRDFPILFDKLIATLEKRYIEYNKDLINSENKIIIRSQKDINDELRKMAGDNNVELVTSYKSDHLDIKFRCKKCRKEFPDIYKNIKRRQPPKLFCPFCFPELIKNPSISKKLKEQITKYSLNKLERIIINNLSEVEILENIKTIKDSVFEQIESQLSRKNSEFKRFLKKYIANIVCFLTKIKLLSETNQKINVSNVAKETHNKSLTSLNQWYKIVKEMVRYLRDTLGFSIRTTHQDPLSLPESSRNSIRSFKTYYKLIKGSDKKGITITYLDIDYKTEIRIYYDGKCQGLGEYCPFNIDHKFLPSLSHHHRLEGYNKIVTEKDYKYIQPREIIRHSFHRALELMQTQIGGLDLTCINCHSIKHSVRYIFPPIFNFLKSLTLEDIKENVANIFNEAEILANKFLEQNKERYGITKINTIAKIKIDIKRSIIGFVKKKYVIEYLFGANYICPVCQKANSNDHLTCFEAHHTNLDLFEKIEKIKFGKEYERKPIHWLIKNLIIQECVYLCSNCHTMIKATTYRDYILIILKNQKEAFFVNNFYKLLDTQIAVKRNIILQWKIQLKDRSLNIANPLQLIFKMGEALDQKVVCIYYICEVFSRETKKHFFTAGVFNFILNKFHTHFNNYKNQLISDGYIQYVKGRHQFNQKFFVITPKGLERAKEIIKKKLKEFSEEFNKLILYWKDRYIEYQNSL